VFRALKEGPEGPRVSGLGGGRRGKRLGRVRDLVFGKGGSSSAERGGRGREGHPLKILGNGEGESGGPRLEKLGSGFLNCPQGRNGFITTLGI